MNEEQITAERILLLIESYPSLTFPYDDRMLSILTNLRIIKIKEIIQELILTGFLKRKRNHGGRVLISLRSVEEQNKGMRQIIMQVQLLELNVLSKEKEETKEKEKKEKRSKKEKNDCYYCFFKKKKQY